MENKFQNVKDSGTVDRQNVSFKFTKKVSKAAIGNKLEEKADSRKDFVLYVNESKIKRYVMVHISFALFHFYFLQRD